VDAGATCVTSQTSRKTRNYDYNYCASLITGIILASLACIFLLVAMVCCCIKKSGHSGRVVSPSPASNDRCRNNLTVVYTGASGQYPVVHHAFSGYNGQPMPARPPQPPEYKRFDPPPPPPAYSDPAYPPGAGPSSSSSVPSVPPPPYAPGPTPGAPRPAFETPGPSPFSGGSGAQSPLDGPPPDTPSVGPFSTALPRGQ
ncbi:hypothetical protein BaRGS_00027841, partial [Batillaria attramentaria]